MLIPLPQSRSRKAKSLRHSDCSSSLPLKTSATDTHFKAVSLPRPPDMLLSPHRGSQGTDIFLALEAKIYVLKISAMTHMLKIFLDSFLVTE